MAKRLYFGGLSYNTTSDVLRDGASKFGTVVSATVVMDKMTGRSRGFGFVEMSTDEEADAVIAGMNGTNFDGREITVNEAKPLEARAPRTGGGFGGGMRRGGGGGGFGGGNDRRGGRDW